MQCKKCGTEIKEGCLFCHNCGEAVQIVPDYEPELENLQLEPVKEKTEPLPMKTDKKQAEEKTEGTKEPREPKKDVKRSFLGKWTLILVVLVVVFGIAAFVIAYGSVLKNQEPDAMLETESQKETETPARVSKPEFGLPGGEYTYYISVTLSTDVPGNIHYTLDGSTPDEASSIYREPVELSEGTTVIRAFVMDEDGNCSDVVSEVYTVEFGAPDAPVIFPESGDYAGEHYIRILVPEGCAAYYTLDGTDPSEADEIYTGEFLMPEGTTTVRAILEDEKGNLSEISTVVYKCTGLDIKI